MILSELNIVKVILDKDTLAKCPLRACLGCKPSWVNKMRQARLFWFFFWQ